MDSWRRVRTEGEFCEVKEVFDPASVQMNWSSKELPGTKKTKKFLNCTSGYMEVRVFTWKKVKMKTTLEFLRIILWSACVWCLLFEIHRCLLKIYLRRARSQCYFFVLIIDVIRVCYPLFHFVHLPKSEDFSWISLSFDRSTQLQDLNCQGD